MASGAKLVREAIGLKRFVWRSPALQALGVPHAFTTRSSWDGAAVDTELVHALGGGQRVASLHQVHGAVVHSVGAESLPAGTCGDALVSDRTDQALLVRTADCVPVLLASVDGRRVAAVHAGWRGLVAGVIPAAVEALGAKPFDAAVGPCLSATRFEVGSEVARAFAEAGLADVVQHNEGRRPHVDLRLAAGLQLERAGACVVDTSDRCTWDDAELFSHRRDVTHGGQETTGRLGALISARA